MDNRISIALGVILFVTGLLMHIIRYTAQIPPERRPLPRYSALAMMIIGGTMAMLPLFAKLSHH